MITTNTLIDRKKMDAMRLLSSSVSKKKVRGQNIETVLNVLAKQMKEVQEGSTEWEKLNREYSMLLRKYNPSLYATMQRNEGTLFLTNSMMSRVQSSASGIIQQAKITTEMSSGVTKLNSSVARAYGSFVKDKQLEKGDLTKAKFLGEVFSTRKVSELQQAFNAASTSKTASYTDRMMAEARLDFRHNLDMIARAAGLDDSVMPTVDKKLSFGIKRMERIAGMISEGRTPLEIERLGYNKKEYEAAKFTIEKMFGSKEIDSRFLIKDDIFEFLSSEDLFKNKSIGESFYAEMGSRNIFKSSTIKDVDADSLIKIYRELFGFDTEGFTAGLSEDMDVLGIMSKRDAKLKVDDFQDLLEKMSGGKVNRDVIDEALEVVQENRRAVLGGGQTVHIRKILEERAKGGGSAYFEGGRLDELHKMKLAAERLKTGTKEDYGIRQVIDVIDNAIIASGGDRRQLTAISRAARGTSLWNLRQAQQAPLQAMMISNWQNIYGGSITNTGGGSLMGDIFKGRSITVTDFIEEIETIAIPGYDAATGRMISGDYWDKATVVKGIKFKGYTEIGREELRASRELISISSEAQRAASKNIIKEITSGQSSYSMESVFEWMLSKSRMIEEGAINISDVERALDGNRTAIDIFKSVQGQYSSASRIITGDIDDVNLLKLFKHSMARAFADVDNKNAEGILSSTRGFSKEQIMAKQEELVGLFQRIFPQISTVQEASSFVTANSIADRAASTTYIRPTLNISEKASNVVNVLGKDFSGDKFSDVWSQVQSSFTRAQLKSIDESEVFSRWRGGTSRYSIPDVSLSDEASAFGRKVSSVRKRLLSDIFKLDGSSLDVRDFQTGYIDDSGRWIKESLKIGDTVVEGSHIKAINSILNSIANENASILKRAQEMESVLLHGVLDAIDSDERIKNILGGDILEPLKARINQMVVGAPNVSFNSSEAMEELLAEKIQKVNKTPRQLESEYKKLDSDIARWMKKLGIENVDGEFFVGQDGNPLYKDSGGIRNIAALVDLETKDRTALDRTLMAFRNQIRKADGNRKLIEQIQAGASRDIEIEGVRNFSIDTAEDGKYITLRGIEDSTSKDISFVFKVEGQGIKQITADELGEDALKLFGEFRGKDFLGHVQAPSSFVESRLKSIGQSVFGDSYDESMKRIASEYFGMTTDSLSGDDIVRAFSATEDLPLHSMRNGIMMEDLVASATHIRPSGNTPMRPAELLGLAMQHEGEIEGSSFNKLSNLIHSVSRNRGQDVDAAEEARRVVDTFKRTISNTEIGGVAQAIIDNDFNTVDLPDKLFRASQNAPERIITAASEFMSEIRGGKHKIPVAMAATTLAIMTIAGSYSVAKDIMPTDPTHGTQTRIAMNDDGYASSITPDRFGSFSGGVNSGGLNSLSSLSSATINDNLDSLDKDFMR